MVAKDWKRKIKAACKDAGTYAEHFDSAIETLADILEKRDLALETFEALGGEPIVEHTNTHGSTNLSKHPALALWDDLNKTALTYWRELGLTPAGLKKINDAALKPKKKSSLAEALKDIG